MRAWLIQALTDAFFEARKNKIKTFNEQTFEEHWPENILKLANAILGRYYQPSPSISFIVSDPMIREIFAAPFIDRVVHHLLYELQGGWWDHHFINDSYSCREDKGTLYGVSRIHQMMRQASENFTKPTYIVKLDIRGYFMSLPREKLYQFVKEGLYQQMHSHFGTHPGAYELFQLCSFLWHQILLDDPASKSRRRGRLRDWDKLPPEKSLYCQPPGRGIVIGNLTSQLVSNIYLDHLDRYVKYSLGYKYYGRYVDDFFFIITEADYKKLKKDIPKIERFLKEQLLLTLHPKKRYCQSIYKGVSFLGVRIYPHCLYPSNRIQSKLNHNLQAIYYGDHINPDTLISYFGQFQHLQGDQFVKSLFTKYQLDYELYLESKSENRRPMGTIIDQLTF